MTKFREHRELLADSMKTVVPCNNWDELVSIVTKLTNKTKEEVSSNLRLEFYIDDDRNNWHTYIVILTGWGVVGYTNGN